MSGVAISVTISDDAVRRAFARLSGMMDNTTPVMSAIGTELVASTTLRFVTQTDPEGAAWTALHPEYAKGKRNARILTESGRLRDSITKVASADEVRVGTNVIYGAIHQFGGTIQPKSASHLFFRMGGNLIVADKVTLPARPYLGISADDETAIAEIVFDFIERFAGR